ncbi:MAG: hypothetical protein GY904_32725 [Planctomycetaceae bacterium]|jgi:hypothetical protein|nr:hypothetical protein [Planctomycetaceae bacterium]
MAVRLSVIMIHTPPAGSGKQSLAEAIVGELIGLPGIDLTLIGPIQSLAESSTDRLSIDAITGDVAMLDWRTPQQSLSELSTIGFQGRRAPHANDPQPPENGVNAGRRIYSFDLSQVSNASTLVSALIQLRDHRQVKTISMGLVTPRQRPTASSSPIPIHPVPVKPVTIEPASPKSKTADTPETQRKSESIDLDELLDQLDQLDP